MPDLGDLFKPGPDSIISPPATAGAAIAQKYAALSGAPGDRTGPLEETRPGIQYVQRYTNGAIYWQSNIGAHWVLGAIHHRYVGLGGPTGFLGLPLTDETPTPDGVGRFNHFQHGSIYWHPTIGAFEVHGPIRECWAANGWERYGYPITDETPTGTGRGRFNHFRRFEPDGTAHETSIYWSPQTGAHAVYGFIRTRWLALGEEFSYLGYPITDELEWTDPDTQRHGRISHFERGSIAWTRDGGTVEFPARRVFRSGHIGVSSVGGWAELTITSSGSFHFRGHLHNSGFVGLQCTVGVAVGIPGTNEAIGVKYGANVGGTTSLDHRDEDWAEDGYKHEIRLKWDELTQASAMRSTIEAGLGGWEVLTLVLLPLVGATVLIALASGPAGPDTKCRTTEGWHTTHDGNNRTTIEPDGVRCSPH